MRKRIGFGLLVLSAIAAVAPGAMADEWIDLFDGETMFGWTVQGEAEWKVSDGELTCLSGSGGWLATTSAFMDFELAVKIRVTRDGSTGIVVRSSLDGHWSENGASELLITEPKEGKPDWHDVVITAQGASVKATVDGKDAELLGGGAVCGHIGFQFHRTGKVDVASARLRPLNMKPIFNGKTLDGWNIIPERKSVFKVVDSAINITNGNGQIETAGLYKNFMLQLNIISNGDHLNSGVFFRGPVGVFWKGYESQVRNEWSDDDRTKPVDFGTGGIYGNQAARKVVSTDREWFTKTIVCHGNHMAVWIDGYQVSDFTDTRPIREDCNAKEGFVPGPGTIHLQGHDPTTDLSFKDIELQEYPN